MEVELGMERWTLCAGGIPRGRENIREIIGPIEIATFLRLVWLTNARVVLFSFCIRIPVNAPGYIYINIDARYFVIKQWSSISDKVISPSFKFSLRIRDVFRIIVIHTLFFHSPPNPYDSVRQSVRGHEFPIGRVIQNWICLWRAHFSADLVNGTADKISPTVIRRCSVS